MVNVPLLEKLKTFITVLRNSPYIIYVLPIIIVIGLLILVSCKIKSRVIKFIYIALYIGIIGFLYYVYQDPILKLIDYLVENIVMAVLFPNLAIYITMIILVNIILLVSIFSKKIKSYVRNINVLCFTLIQLLLYLIINNIINNNINVYEKLTVYTNQELLILIELSTQLFIIWLLVLGTIKLIDVLIIKSTKRKTINNKLVIKYEVKSDELIEYEPIKKRAN